MPKFIAPLQHLRQDLTQHPNDTHWWHRCAQLSVLRLDQIPPAYSGNKLFKLKHSLQQAKAQGKKRLISFGGAYSNHIHALALAGQHYGFKTVGIIRGEPATALNPTLSDAENAGMALRFVTRQEYRLRHDADYLSQLGANYPDSYIIPEGGSNLGAVRSCMEIVDHIQHHINNHFDVIILPSATAATLAGVIAAAPADKVVIGVAVLNNGEQQTQQVEQYLTELGESNKKQWRIEVNYHCGGYAKLNKELVKFMTHFQQRNKIDIEPIYSGKMFYALSQLLEKKAIDAKSRIIAIHTGGLQGLRGMQAKMDRLLLSAKARTKHEQF
jgi:1-aminocyclopropane-1-carboxylate deaminase/D-cysteine desulfhydrase-like pyridoxal-dependent ACC family enzyme